MKTYRVFFMDNLELFIKAENKQSALKISSSLITIKGFPKGQEIPDGYGCIVQKTKRQARHE